MTHSVIRAAKAQAGPDAKVDVTWHIATLLRKRRALDKDDTGDDLVDKRKKFKATARAKIKHPISVHKRQFGHVKVRHRGLGKHTAQLLIEVFALSNL